MIILIASLAAAGVVVVTGIAVHERSRQHNELEALTATTNADQRRRGYAAHIETHGFRSFLAFFTRHNFGAQLTELDRRESTADEEIEHLAEEEKRFAHDAPNVTPKMAAAARFLLAIAGGLLIAETALQFEFLRGAGLHPELALGFAVVSAGFLEMVAMGFKFAKQRCDTQGPLEKQALHAEQQRRADRASNIGFRLEDDAASEDDGSSTERVPVIRAQGMFALQVFGLGIIVALFIGAGIFSGRSRSKDAASAVDLAEAQLAFVKAGDDEQAVQIAESQVRSATRELEDQTRLAAMYGGVIPLGVVASGIAASWALSVVRVDRIRRKKRAAEKKLADIGRERRALEDRIINEASSVLAELGIDPEQIHQFDNDAPSGDDDAGQDSSQPAPGADHSSEDRTGPQDEHAGEAADADAEEARFDDEDVSEDPDDSSSDDAPPADESQWSEI